MANKYGSDKLERGRGDIMDIRALIKEEVLAQKAYPVETTPAGSNSMPMKIRWPFPESSGRDLRRCWPPFELNRYPEAGSVALTSRFATAFGVDADQVMIGNGSDELIQILCTALARPGAEVMIPVPTFAMYRISALNAGLRVAAVPLDERVRSRSSRPCGRGWRRSPPP